MTLNAAAFDAAYKQLYPLQRIQSLVYKDSPFFAMVKKNPKMYGRNSQITQKYGNPQGRSHSFAKAKANAGSTGLKAFDVTRVKDYGYATIENEIIEASESDAGALVRAVKLEMDGILESLGESIAFGCFRSGTGVRGRIVAGQSMAASEIALSNPEDIVNFEVGMALQLSTADGGGAVKSGVAWVIKVNRAEGKFTVSATQGGAAANLSTIIATAAAEDYIFVEGDYDAGIKGLGAWLPYGGPTSSLFFGVDRTVDEQRLAGLWFDGTGLAPEEGLIKFGQQLGRAGASTSHIFMSHNDFADLHLSMGSRKTYCTDSAFSNAKITFQGIELPMGKRVAKIFPDVRCPDGLGYLLQLDTWTLGSLGTAPKLFTTDGRPLLREADEDGVEIRANYYGNMYCEAVGWNGVIKFR